MERTETEDVRALQEREPIVLSTLPKTWILDLDGTILKHNGYKLDGKDTLIDTAVDYIRKIPEEDFILILTSRTDEYKDMTISFLNENDIRYNEILFNVPMGERIVINDRKPSGINMTLAVNIDRNKWNIPGVRREL